MTVVRHDEAAIASQIEVLVGCCCCCCWTIRWRGIFRVRLYASCYRRREIIPRRP